MVVGGLYFGKPELYQLIRYSGGQWNDSKERPVVCMFKSTEYDHLYWAVPMGNWAHRNKKAQDRILRYMSYPDSDLRSCYYHVGNTDVKSIFFISDAFPITDEYVDHEYLNKYTKQIYVIQNKPLIAEVNRKLARILSFEKQKPNYFRQHITDIVKALTP